MAAISFASQVAPPNRPLASPPHVADALAKQPITFERNEGQVEKNFDYVSRGSGYTFLLQPAGTIMSLQASDQGRADIAMSFMGGNPMARPVSSSPAHTRVNYLIGHDPKKWHIDVPTFEQIRYHAVYPGVDVVYYGNQQQLEYDFVVQPGADPRQIRVAFDGADKVRLTKDGDLVLDASGREVRHRRPIAYQIIGGKHVSVPVSYRVAGENEVAFEIASYDCHAELVIDPVLTFSTFFGGISDTILNSMVVDASGNIFIGGGTAGNPRLATSGALQSTSHLTSSKYFNGLFGVYDGYVAKINALGSSVDFMTYIGGTGNDVVWGVALDSTGSIIAGGETASADFPTTVGALRQTLPNGFGAGVPHGFLARLNGSGTSLIYSTYLGGDTIYATDRVLAVATDSSGGAYATGETEAADFPVSAGAYQPQGAYDKLLGRHDAFVTKLDATGALVYSTYLGGPHGYDRADAIAVDASGNAYVRTRSDYFDFPMTTNVLGSSNYYVTKLNPAGTALVWSTGLGGSIQRPVFSEPVSVGGLAVDSNGAVWVTGWTGDNTLPTTAGAYQTTYNGCKTAFVMKLAPDGLSRVFSTLLNGDCNSGGFSDFSEAHSVAVDASGNGYVVGTEIGKNFPSINGLQAKTTPKCDNNCEPSQDAFLAIFDPSGNPSFITPLGGTAAESGLAVAFNGQPIIGGSTEQKNIDDFYYKNGISATAEGRRGPVFIAKINTTTPTPGFSITDVSRVVPTDATSPQLAPYFFVHGFGFQTGATATVGGANAGVLEVNSPNDLEIDLPTLPPGDYELILKNPDQSTAHFSSVQTRDFPLGVGCSFDTHPLNPDNAPSTGGTHMTILGQGGGFQPGVTVFFGDTPAQSVNRVSSTQIDVVTPPHPPGRVPMTILNPDGTYLTGEQLSGFCGTTFTFTVANSIVPTITSISPTSVPGGSSQNITIHGTHLTNTSIFVAGGSSRFQRIIDDSTAVVEVTPAVPGEYDVTAFTADPSVKGVLPFALKRTADTSITPYYGPPAGGTQVTIKGRDFKPGAQVYMCNVLMPATNVTVVDSNTITALTPVSGGGRTGCVYWVWNAGTDNELFNFDEEWSYTDFNGNVTISSVAPASGYTTGGDSVTINGSGFINNFTEVFFGGVLSRNLNFISSTQIVAQTPPHLAGTVDVLVAVNDGNASSAIQTNAFTYGPPPPGPFNVSPNKGLPAGGTNISITGSGFQAGATVTIGGAALANMKIWSSTLITGTTPAHAVGPVDIVITNPDTQTRTLTNGFTYAYPVVTLTPPSQTIAPNGTGTLTATLDFPQSTDTTITLASSDTTIVTVPGSVTITAGQTSNTFTVTATANPGSITITATLPPALNSGTGTATVNVPAAPNIVSFTPASGPSGTSVTITGTRFTGTTSVTFGGISATFTVNSDTQITATAPNNGVNGPICATTPGPLTGCSTTDFSFPPRVTGFNPSSGLPGTSVTINGANFQGATAVSFNGSAASPFTFAPNGQSITTTVPAAATTGTVSVTTPAGTGTSASPFGVPPSITNVSPGTAGPGTAVTITGVRFTGTTGVSFNGTSATFTVVNDTTINTTVPNGASSGPISVTTPGGTGTSSPFVVAATASVTSFTPAKGNTGTSVAITGVHFTGATDVRFNGLSATSFVINSDASITAIAPASTNGPISIVTPLGTGSSTSVFAYPTVISTFAPSAAAVGATVTINGNNFIGTTAVAFHGTAAGFTVNAQNQITATVPSSATSGVITVTTPFGPVSSSTSFSVLPPGTPSLVATATSSTSVSLVWAPVTGHSYGIERITDKNQVFSAHRIATVTGSTYTDNTVSPGTTYLYHIVDVNTGQIGNNDYATTIIFTDDPVASGIAVKAAHLIELRNAVNAMRVAGALSPMTWTDPSPAGVLIRPEHITELRNALREAMVALGRYVNYTDPTLTTGMPVRALHFQELRDAVK